jgi:hypothetical protein
MAVRLKKAKMQFGGTRGRVGAMGTLFSSTRRFFSLKDLPICQNTRLLVMSIVNFWLGLILKKVKPKRLSARAQLLLSTSKAVIYFASPKRTH